jgi:hypothetical protein
VREQRRNRQRTHTHQTNNRVGAPSGAVEKESDSLVVEPYEAERPDGYASIYQNNTYAVL